MLLQLLRRLQRISVIIRLHTALIIDGVRGEPGTVIKCDEANTRRHEFGK